MEVIPSSESGELDVAALEEMLSRGGVKAVAITHVPTNGGVVNPATEGLNHGTIRGTLRFCRCHRPLIHRNRCAIRAHTVVHTARFARVVAGAGTLMCAAMYARSLATTASSSFPLSALGY